MRLDSKIRRTIFLWLVSLNSSADASVALLHLCQQSHKEISLLDPPAVRLHCDTHSRSQSRFYDDDMSVIPRIQTREYNASTKKNDPGIDGSSEELNILP